MYCIRCGAQLPDDSRFCHVCGEEISVNNVESQDKKTSDEQMVVKEYSADDNDKAEHLHGQFKAIAIINAFFSCLWVLFGFLGRVVLTGRNTEQITMVVFILVPVLLIPTAFIFPPIIFTKYCQLKNRFGIVTKGTKTLKNITIVACVFVWYVMMALTS